MIRAFLFDYGGVMTNGGKGNELQARFAANLSIPVYEAARLIAEPWAAFSSGKIDEATFWSDVESSYGAPIPENERDIWNQWDTMKILPEMKSLVLRLKATGYTVGLVSNTIPPTATVIRAHGGYEVFDFSILSFEVGYVKPQVEIYNIALSNLGDITPEEVVFIDDQERCLEPARILGMQTMLVEDPMITVKELELLL